MGGDFFDCNALCVFFDHILHRPHADALALTRKKEGIFIFVLG